MTLPGHPVSPSTFIPSPISIPAFIPAWPLPTPARDHELCLAATRGHGGHTHGEATLKDASCPERTRGVPPLFRHSPLAFSLLLSPAWHPAGLHPAPPPQRHILPLSCLLLNDSRVLGPGCLSGWRGQAPVPYDQLGPQGLSLAPSCPGPLPGSGEEQGTAGTSLAPLYVAFTLFCVFHPCCDRRCPLPSPFHLFHGTVPAQGPVCCHTPRSAPASCYMGMSPLPPPSSEWGIACGPGLVVAMKPHHLAWEEQFPSVTAQPLFSSQIRAISSTSCKHWCTLTTFQKHYDHLPPHTKIPPPASAGGHLLYSLASTLLSNFRLTTCFVLQPPSPAGWRCGMGTRSQLL